MWVTNLTPPLGRFTTATHWIGGSEPRVRYRTGRLGEEKILSLPEIELWTIQPIVWSFWSFKKLRHSTESFVFQFAIQKVKDQDVYNYNIARCSVWVWNFVANIEVGT